MVEDLVKAALTSVWSRRAFITMAGASILPSSPAAEGQQAGKVPRIGFLSTQPSPNVEAFKQQPHSLLALTGLARHILTHIDREGSL